MTEPRGVNPKLQYCSEAIRAHPLPHDDCAKPLPPWSPPGERYRRISLFIDPAINFHLTPFDKDFQLGAGGVFRPGGKTALGFWGLGAQVETKFEKDVTVLGRIQDSFNLQRYGRDRLTLAALGGVRFEDQTGSLAQVGMEAALEWHLVANLGWPLITNMTLTLPYISARYTFTGSAPQQDAQVPDWNLIVGARWSFDMLPVGE
jgi:hypothetical protein